MSLSVMSIFKTPKKEISTDVIPVKQQADINIFTVASGLLYEVRTIMCVYLSGLVTELSLLRAIRWYHDLKRSPKYKQHCQVLVH